MSQVITQEQYEELKEKCRVEHGYYDYTDEKKESFDEKFDKVSAEIFEIEDDDSDDNQTDTERIDEKKMKVSSAEMEELKQRQREVCGYDRSCNAETV